MKETPEQMTHRRKMTANERTGYGIALGLMIFAGQLALLLVLAN